jgi:hypothetical protein
VVPCGGTKGKGVGAIGLAVEGLGRRDSELQIGCTAAGQDELRRTEKGIVRA